MNALTTTDPSAEPMQTEGDAVGMTDDEFERFVAKEIADAQTYVYTSDEIAAERERNYNYYLGVMDDVPYAKGRSKVVDRTVKTYINMMLPNLTRVFTSGRVGSYSPVGAQDDLETQKLTKYVNGIVLRKDNSFRNLLRDWAKTALLQKLGVVKAWWETEFEEKDDTFEGVNEIQLMAMMAMEAQGGPKVVAITGIDTTIDSPQGQIQTKVYSVTRRRKINRSRVCIANLAPEEFCISADAQSFRDAVLITHRAKKKIGDLVKMGIDRSLLINLPAYTRVVAVNFTQPRDNPNQRDARNPPEDPDLKEVTVHEGIVRCDYDGTGIKPWYILVGGDESGVKKLKCEPYKYQVGFAGFCPDPLPNRVYGSCPADDLAEIQKVGTVLIRQMLDNLYLTNTPQREVVQDLIIKPDQLMNMAPGSPVLVKAPNAIREMTVPFMGQYALQALQYFDEKAEMRSGVSKASMGLDPDALQNQTARAAEIAHAASMGKIDEIAAIWADGGMTDLFRLILDILIEYQDFERIEMIDGKPQSIDPRKWQSLAEIDIQINTGLGTGSREKDAAAIVAIAGFQEKLLGVLGPGNPAVGPQQAVNTAQKYIEATGIENYELFVANLPEGWMPTPPPPQGPEYATPDTKANAQAIVAAEQVKAGVADRKNQGQLRIDFVHEANRHAEVMAGLANDGTQIQLNAAKALSDAEKWQKEADNALKIKAADLAAKASPKSEDGKLAAALEGMTQAIREVNKPKRIVRDDKGRAIGTEATN